MPTAVPTTMDVLLPLLLDRLASATGLPPEQVNPWIGEDSPRLTGHQDLVVVLRGFSPDQGWIQGGGRASPLVRERVEVRVRTRLAVDPVGSAKSWLIDQALGHLRVRTAVIDALLDWLPVDEDDNCLVASEVILDAEAGPRTSNRPAAPVDWGEERLNFVFPYIHAVSQ